MRVMGNKLGSSAMVHEITGGLLCEKLRSICVYPRFVFVTLPLPTPVSSEYDETYQSASSPCDGCGFYKMEDNIKNESNANKSEEVLAVSRESYIMKQLQGQQGIPQIMWSGRMLWQGALNEALVMQLLGPSMQEMNERYGDQGRISLRSAIVLAVQLLSILEAVHKLVTLALPFPSPPYHPPPTPPPRRIFLKSRCGFIHCDIKPENILLGVAGSPTAHVCHLVDFGFSVPYMELNTSGPTQVYLANP